MKLNLTSVLPYALCIVLGALLFHKTAAPSIPLIITHYDTVSVTEFKHDTQFVTRLKHDTVYQTNVVEKVVTAPPETVHVFHELSGMTGIHAAQKWGDTTKVLYFRMTGNDSTPPTFTLSKNLQYYFTPGPVQDVFLTDSGTPHVSFGDKFPVCHPVKDVAIGAGGITLLRLLLGK